MKLLLAALLFVGALRAADVNTFSIVAYDAAAGDWGVAVASRYFSVGAVVPWAEAGTGAIATQADVNVGYGPRGLDLLRRGLSAQEVLDKLRAEDQFPGKEGRQVAIIDHNGSIAAYTGPSAPSWAGGRQGKTWAAQGNILVGPQVVEAMGHAFESTDGELAEKLFAALKAGDDAGGDSRGKQSASLLVVRKGGGRNTNNDRYLYLNVDDNPQPLLELRRLLNINLGLLYQQRTGVLIRDGKPLDARNAARKVTQYMPSAAAYVTLGALDYQLNEKAAALADLRQALQLDPDLRRQIETAPGEKLGPISEDHEFLRQLFNNPGTDGTFLASPPRAR